MAAKVYTIPQLSQKTRESSPNLTMPLRTMLWSKSAIHSLNRPWWCVTNNVLDLIMSEHSSLLACRCSYVYIIEYTAYWTQSAQQRRCGTWNRFIDVSSGSCQRCCRPHEELADSAWRAVHEDCRLSLLTVRYSGSDWMLCQEVPRPPSIPRSRTTASWGVHYLAPTWSTKGNWEPCTLRRFWIIHITGPRHCKYSLLFMIVGMNINILILIGQGGPDERKFNWSWEHKREPANVSRRLGYVPRRFAPLPYDNSSWT